MWHIWMARTTKEWRQNIINGPLSFNFNNSLFVVYDILERVHLWPHITQTFKPLKRPMLLGHMTLNAFMASCTEGFRREPCNWQSAFPSNSKERLACRSGKNLSNTMGENARSNKRNPHGLHITRFSLITYIILTNNYHRNMYTLHSTF